jgi:hypothetical protein
VAAWFLDVLQLLFSEISQYCFIIAKKLTTTKAREKISTYLKSLELKNYVCLTKFKNNEILFNKISHRFLLTLKLFTG